MLFRTRPEHLDLPVSQSPRESQSKCHAHEPRADTRAVHVVCRIMAHVRELGIGIWGHAAATVRPHRFVGHTIIVPGCGMAPLGARDTGQLPKCAQWTGHVAL